MPRNNPLPLPSGPSLREIFEYNYETGIITWRKDRFNNLGRRVAKAGTEAGCIQKSRGGYRIISLGGRHERAIYYAHRLAWKLFYGEEPPIEIDHIDHNRGNNAIENLRMASRAENSANRVVSRRNKSGLSGVSWDKRTNKWRVHVGSNWLGDFSDYNEAVRLRKNSAAEIFGEFAPK